MALDNNTLDILGSLGKEEAASFIADTASSINIDEPNLEHVYMTDVAAQAARDGEPADPLPNTYRKIGLLKKDEKGSWYGEYEGGSVPQSIMEGDWLAVSDTFGRGTVLNAFKQLGISEKQMSQEVIDYAREGKDVDFTALALRRQDDGSLKWTLTNAPEFSNAPETAKVLQDVVVVANKKFDKEYNVFKTEYDKNSAQLYSILSKGRKELNDISGGITRDAIIYGIASLNSTKGITPSTKLGDETLKAIYAMLSDEETSKVLIQNIRAEDFRKPELLVARMDYLIDKVKGEKIALAQDDKKLTELNNQYGSVEGSFNLLNSIYQPKFDELSARSNEINAAIESMPHLKLSEAGSKLYGDVNVKINDLVKTANSLGSSLKEREDKLKTLRSKSTTSNGAPVFNSKEDLAEYNKVMDEYKTLSVEYKSLEKKLSLAELDRLSIISDEKNKGTLTIPTPSSEDEVSALNNLFDSASIIKEEYELLESSYLKEANPLNTRYSSLKKEWDSYNTQLKNGLYNMPTLKDTRSLTSLGIITKALGVHERDVNSLRSALIEGSGFRQTPDLLAWSGAKLMDSFKGFWYNSLGMGTRSDKLSYNIDRNLLESITAPRLANQLNTDGSINRLNQFKNSYLEFASSFAESGSAFLLNLVPVGGAVGRVVKFAVTDLSIFASSSNQAYREITSLIDEQGRTVGESSAKRWSHFIGAVNVLTEKISKDKTPNISAAMSMQAVVNFNLGKGSVGLSKILIPYVKESMKAMPKMAFGQWSEEVAAFVIGDMVAKNIYNRNLDENNTKRFTEASAEDFLQMTYQTLMMSVTFFGAGQAKSAVGGAKTALNYAKHGDAYLIAEAIKNNPRQYAEFLTSVKAALDNGAVSPEFYADINARLQTATEAFKYVSTELKDMPTEVVAEVLELDEAARLLSSDKTILEESLLTTNEIIDSKQSSEETVEEAKKTKEKILQELETVNKKIDETSESLTTVSERYDEIIAKQRLAVQNHTNDLISQFAGDYTDNSTVAYKDRVQSLLLGDGDKLTQAEFDGVRNGTVEATVITSQNQRGVQSSKEYNENSINELEAKLKSEGFRVVRVTGKYGSIEDTLIVFGMGKSKASSIAKSNNQVSFIYSDGQGSVEMQYTDGSVEFAQKDGSGKLYQDKDVDTMLALGDEVDFITSAPVVTEDGGVMAGNFSWNFGMGARSATFNNSSDIAEALSNSYNDKSRQILSAAQAAMAAHEKLGRTTDITLHWSDESFNAVDQKAKGSRGIVITQTKTDLGGVSHIHINVNKATPSTVIHESNHPLVESLYTHIMERDGISKEAAIQKLYDQISKTRAFKEISVGIIARYGTSIKVWSESIKNDIERMDEVVTEYMARVGDGTISVDRIDMGVRSSIKDSINSVMEKFGVGDYVKNSSDLSSAIRLFQDIYDGNVRASAKKILSRPATEISQSPLDAPLADGVDITVKTQPVEGRERILFRGKSKDSKHRGSFFSDSEAYSKSFAAVKDNGIVDKVALKHSAKIFDIGYDTGINNLVEKIKEAIPNLTNEEVSQIRNRNYKSVLKERGYDGVSYKEGDSQTDKEANTFELFNPEQSTSTIDIETKTQTIPTKISKFLTDDGQGNFLFFHYGDIKGESIDPKYFGRSSYTKDRRMHGVSFFYTRPQDRESMVSGQAHVVKIPQDRVYPFNSDPLGLYDQALKNFLQDFPSGAFSPDMQIDYINQLAVENGFDIAVALWDGKVRGESVKPLAFDKGLTSVMREFGDFSDTARVEKLEIDLANALSENMEYDAQAYLSRHGIEKTINHKKHGAKIPQGYVDAFKSGAVILEDVNPHSAIAEPVTLKDSHLSEISKAEVIVKDSEALSRMFSEEQKNIYEARVVDVKSLIENFQKDNKRLPLIYTWGGDHSTRGDYYNPATGVRVANIGGGIGYALAKENIAKLAAWATGENLAKIATSQRNADFIFIIANKSDTNHFFNRKSTDVFKAEVLAAIEKTHSGKGLDLFNIFKKLVEKGNIQTPIKKVIKNATTFEEFFDNTRSSEDRGEILRKLFYDVKKSNSTPSGFLANTVGIPSLSEINQYLREPLIDKLGLEIGDVMMVIKPNNINGAPSESMFKGVKVHDTYNNIVGGEVLGIPSQKIDAIELFKNEISFIDKNGDPTTRSQQRRGFQLGKLYASPDAGVISEVTKAEHIADVTGRLQAHRDAIINYDNRKSLQDTLFKKGSRMLTESQYGLMVHLRNFGKAGIIAESLLRTQRGSGTAAETITAEYNERIFGNISRKKAVFGRYGKTSEYELTGIMINYERIVEIQRMMEYKFSRMIFNANEVNRILQSPELAQLNSELAFLVSQRDEANRLLVGAKNSLTVELTKNTAGTRINQLRSDIDLYEQYAQEFRDKISDKRSEITDFSKDAVVLTEKIKDDAEYLQDNKVFIKDSGDVFINEDGTINTDVVSLGLFTSDGIYSEKAQEYLDAMRAELGDEQYSKLQKAATELNYVYSELLKQKHDEGLISEDLYNYLKMWRYSPLTYIDKILGEGTVARNDLMQSGQFPKTGIQSLSGGSVDSIIYDHSAILGNMVNAMYKNIAVNRTLNAIAQIAETTPDNPEMRMAKPELNMDGSVKVGAYGSPVYGKPSDGMSHVPFFRDGKRYMMEVKHAGKAGQTELYEELFEGAVNQSLTELGIIFGVPLFQTLVTGANVAFGVAQILIDAPTAILATRAFNPSLTIAVGQAVSSYPKIFYKVSKGYKDSDFREAALAGAFTGFYKEDMVQSLRDLASFSGLPSGERTKIMQMMKAMGNVVNAVEQSTKLMVYIRMRHKLLAEGMDSSEATLMAAAEARRATDFARGGYAIRALSKLFPYLNANVQAKSSVLRGLNQRTTIMGKQLPVVGALRVTEALTALVGVLMYNLGVVGGDDEERKRRLDLWNQKNGVLSTMKYRFMLIEVGTNPDKPYLRMPVPDIIQPVYELIVKWAEGVYGSTEGADLGDVIKTADGVLPLSFSALLNKQPPLLSAGIKMMFGVDPFTFKPLYYKEGKMDAKDEGMEDDKIPQPIKSFGQFTGFSPVRVLGAIQSFTGGFQNNPLMNIPLELASSINSYLKNETPDIVVNARESVGHTALSLLGLDFRLFTQSNPTSRNSMSVAIGASALEASANGINLKEFKKIVRSLDENQLATLPKNSQLLISHIWSGLRKSKNIEATGKVFDSILNDDNTIRKAIISSSIRGTSPFAGRLEWLNKVDGYDTVPKARTIYNEVKGMSNETRRLALKDLRDAGILTQSVVKADEGLSEFVEILKQQKTSGLSLPTLPRPSLPSLRSAPPAKKIDWLGIKDVREE